VLRYVVLLHGGLDLGGDESQYWHWSLALDWGYSSKPPLIAWLIAGTTALCGDGEACIRAAVPFLHALTSLVLLRLGWEMAGPRAGAIAGFGFASLPGVSFSALFVTTDVPLLLAWSTALWLLWRLVATPRWPLAIGLGVAIGIGLLAKIAMAYFVLCLAIFLVLAPAARPLLRRPLLWGALAIGAAMLTPTLAWNIANGWATVQHTADNIRGGGGGGGLASAGMFAIGQIAILGPVLAGLVAVAWWRAIALPRDTATAMLLAFGLPLLLLLLIQAAMSRAHANWAVSAYPAALLLLGRLCAERGWRLVPRAAIGLNLAVAICGYALVLAAGRVGLPWLPDPFAELRSGRAIAGWAVEAARREGATAIVADSRQLIASLVYYARDSGLPVRAITRGGNHFERNLPLEPGHARVLLVSREPGGASLRPEFGDLRLLERRIVPRGTRSTLRLHLVLGSRGS